jgi:arsenate reductase
MAEALLPLIGGQDFVTASAGTQPVGLHPMSVMAMDELGVDLRTRRSKHVSEFAGQTFDYVITVCDRAKESCPVLPGTHKLLHWSFDDPAAAPPDRRLEEFRRVRDEIANRLYLFLTNEFNLAPPV